MSFACTVCGIEHIDFNSLRLIGYDCGVDTDNRAVLIAHRNCKCDATFSRPVERREVIRAMLVDDRRIASSAVEAIESARQHEEGRQHE